MIFSLAELPLLEDAVLVHSHPIGEDTNREALTFSDLDLVFAVRYNLQESRVVTGDWRFVMQRGGAIWPADEDIVLTVYNEQAEGVDLELSVAVAEGRISGHEYAVLYGHIVMQRVAMWGGFVYRKERGGWR